MPPSGGNGNHHDNNHHNNNNYPPSPYNRPPGFVPRYRPPGTGRHFNPYWSGAWRRRAPTWLLNPYAGKPKPKNHYWVFIVGGLLVLTIIATLVISFAAVAAPITVGSALYTERYNSLSLDKDYSLTFETTRIYDRKGVLLYEKQPDEGLREYVTIDQIPKVLIDATTAAEDPTFFDNKGVDPYAILRAAYINVSGNGSSGASTITQQVARGVYLPPRERVQNTLDRKIDEAILAIKITDKFSKEQILEKYFNNIYYGNLAYGIQAAALGYFGKQAKDLDLAEASMLAGLPQAPSAYDPTKDYDLARRRQRIVLDLMVKYNRITQPEADVAYREDLQSRLVDRRKKQSSMLAPHFVNYVLQQFQGAINSSQMDQIGITPDDFSQGGYSIYTTIDLDMVNKAQEVVKSNVEELKKRKASNAALVALQPSTGEILAMIGSTDYNDEKNQGQFNAAIARRQPGSALKPLTYAFAMEKGWTAATVLADVTTEFPSGGPTPYVPHNFDNSEHGPVSVRQALGSSLNIPAVKALQFDGVDNFMNEAKKMGITFQYGPERYGLTLTLGGGEVRLLDLTGAYSVFDNLGDKVDTVSILKVTRHGETLYQYDPQQVKRTNVVSPQISYVITNILSDNDARLLAFSRNNPLVLDRPAAAKTGTSNDFVDSWTIGYTPDLVAGVWVGNNNNTPMDGVAGSVGGGLVWNSFMNAVYKDPKLSDIIKQGGQLTRDFARPDGLEEVSVCVESGLLPNDACPQRRKEIFPKNDVPKKVSDIHRYMKVPRRQAMVVPTPDPNNPDATPVAQPVRAEGDILYCVPDDSWPQDQLVSVLFYVYPPELQGWAAKQGRRPPPTQSCGTYAPPTPTPTPTPTVTPTPQDDGSGTPANPPDGGGDTSLTPTPTQGGPVQPGPRPGTPAPTKAVAPPPKQQPPATPKPGG
ncbi:MAG TPA: transglycosylase domain-containing protein [Chloroflexia bacterium]|nr:transglycosylase domain-containing protein [Chloroflexia bacterium]